MHITKQDIDMFKTKYRVITDNYNGFQSIKKVWFWPFWFRVIGSTTVTTKEEAKKAIDNDGVVIGNFVQDNRR